jgi:type II secretory pathway predicted ATPase ExeA
MINATFGITRIPFTKDIPSADLFMHPQFSEFSSRLAFLFNSRGIGLFTGEVGCGKSTALRLTCQDLPVQTHKVVYLCRGLDNVGAFYTHLAHQLDIIPKFRKTDVAAQVTAAISELAAVHKVATVLVIDEAHMLKPELLDEIRLLHNAQFDSTDQLATALVGQPSLRKNLDLNRFLPLKQRLCVSAHIGPLDLNHAQEYFNHQIAVVKPSTPIFEIQAVNAILAASKGVPRLINSIALKAMTRAAQLKRYPVHTETVMAILDEMGLK